MEQIVTQLYGEYGRYINQFRAFPFILDGAKLVERRLLYSLYEVGRDHYVKSAKVVGHCIAHYHPHGDTSAYQSLVGIVQNELAVGQGNWGNNVGIDPNPPAAQRYTEIRSHKEVLKLCFEHIKAVPMSEVEMDPEPVFLPTKLPLCFLGTSNYCQGMGFGYRTMIPRYNKSDLIKRLMWLVNGKKGDEPIISPISDCRIKSPKSELKKLLQTGKAKLEFQGKVTQCGRNSVTVTSVSPSRSFSAILKKFNKELTVDKSLGWHDESKTSTKVKFTITRPRMLKVSTLLKKMKEAISGSLTFECHFCNTKGKVVLLSVDDMLINVYKVYKQIIQKVLSDQSKSIQSSIDELILISKIKPILSEELKIHPDDVDAVIKSVATKLSEREQKIKEIFDKYTIGRIFKVKIDVQKLQSDKAGVDSNLKDLVKYIWKEKYLK